MYKKLHLPAIYWQSATFPEESTYSFTPISSYVPIESLYEVLPPKGREVVEYLYNTGVIREHNCYENALSVSKALGYEGYEVKCIEGELRYPDGTALAHRFCEYNGRYFDATLECIHGEEVLYTIQYYASRAYSANEMMAISLALAAAEGFGKGKMNFQSTITIPQSELEKFNDYPAYTLNDEGKIVVYPIVD